MQVRPLVIDLDGTLVHTDLLHETSVGLMKASFLQVFLIPVILLLRGKAGLKQWLAARSRVDASVLPYNKDLLEWLRKEREDG